MGSPCVLVFRDGVRSRYGAAAARIHTEIRRLESAYSRFLPDSITSRINRAAGSGTVVGINEETARLLDYADTCYRQSDGLFDITSGALRAVWNYQVLEEQQALPSDQAVTAALARVGWEKVSRTERSIMLPEAGMEVDFGGIVKEYAADCAAEIARAEGITSGLIELGGDIRVVGPESGGLPWQVGIRDPRHTDKACASVSLHQGGIASSGDYERYMVIDGKKFSHILDPKTGWPVEGFASVSVVAGQCVVAGSAATIAVLKGQEGRLWLDELGLPYLCIDESGVISGSLDSAPSQ